MSRSTAVRSRRDWARRALVDVSLLFVQVFVALSVVITLPGTALATHGSCEEANQQGLWFISVRSSTSHTTAQGNRGTSTMRTNVNLESFGGSHVESLYVIFDNNNFMEFGWFIDRPGFTTGPTTVFEARMFSGDYATRNLEFDLTGDHRFWVYYTSGDDKWHFRRDSTVYAEQRDSPFNFGSPLAFGEINNQCDGGFTHWWGLDRKTSGGNWSDWNGTHWTCDEERHWGYTAVSDTEFRIESRTDNYVSPTYPNCNPIAS